MIHDEHSPPSSSRFSRSSCRAAGLRACASFEPTLFVSPYAPDTPLDRFAAGELGVLQPTWIRAYLVVSYRYLAGIPLGPDEQAAALAYLEGTRDGLARRADAWTAAREDSGARAKRDQADRQPERWVGYSSYVNCGDDAFGRAAKTLQGYVGRYGKDVSRDAGLAGRAGGRVRELLRREAFLPGIPPRLRSGAAPRRPRLPARVGELLRGTSRRSAEGLRGDRDRLLLALARDRTLSRRSGSPASGDARLRRENRRSPASRRGARAVHGRSRRTRGRRSSARWSEDLLRFVELQSGSRRARRLRRRASPEAADRGRVRGLLRPLPRSPGPGARPRARRSPGRTLRVRPEGRPDELDRGVSDERRSRARPGARRLDSDAREPVARGGRSRKSRRTIPATRRSRRPPGASPERARARPCRVPSRATSRRRPAGPPRPGRSSRRRSRRRRPRGRRRRTCSSTSSSGTRRPSRSSSRRLRGAPSTSTGSLQGRRISSTKRARRSCTTGFRSIGSSGSSRSPRSNRSPARICRKSSLRARSSSAAWTSRSAWRRS